MKVESGPLEDYYPLYRAFYRLPCQFGVGCHDHVEVYLRCMMLRLIGAYYSRLPEVGIWMCSFFCFGLGLEDGHVSTVYCSSTEYLDLQSTQKNGMYHKMRVFLGHGFVHFGSPGTLSATKNGHKHLYMHTCLSIYLFI